MHVISHMIMSSHVTQWQKNQNQQFFTQPKGYLYAPLDSSPPPLRKTPVHRLYSSGIGRPLKSDGPTRGPPVLSRLPQGFHHLYSHIEYECASPFYHHAGSSRRTCLKTGKWSGRHVSCSPGGASKGLLVGDWQQNAQNKHILEQSTTMCEHIMMM